MIPPRPFAIYFFGIWGLQFQHKRKSKTTYTTVEWEASAGIQGNITRFRWVSLHTPGKKEKSVRIVSNIQQHKNISI